MVIFTRTYELLQWLLPRSERFPKAQRFVVTKRLQDAALDFQEALYLANAHSGRTRLTHLRNADAHLNKLRLYVRLIREWGWITAKQHEHVSKLIANIGPLLGGWIRQSKSSK